MVLDMGFGSDTPKSIFNPYPFKKIGFYPYPYPLSSQRIFLPFDRIGSGRKSTDTDTFAISIYMPFVASKNVLRHPKHDASKNMPTPTVLENYEILRAN